MDKPSTYHLKKLGINTSTCAESRSTSVTTTNLITNAAMFHVKKKTPLSLVHKLGVYVDFVTHSTIFPTIANIPFFNEMHE